MDEPVFLYKESDDPRWYWVIEIMDLFAACGEDEAEDMTGNKRFQFCATVCLVPSFDVLKETEQQHMIDDRGMDQDEIEDLSNADWLWDIHCYGIYISDSSEYATTEKQALRKLRRAIDLDVEEVLDKVVNAMGQTGFGHLEHNLNYTRYLEKDPNAVIPERVH